MQCKKKAGSERGITAPQPQSCLSGDTKPPHSSAPQVRRRGGVAIRGQILARLMLLPRRDEDASGT
jgi:hypothetical protein